MRSRTCLLAVATVGLGIVPALANIPEPTLRDKQQAACYGDVMKFCAADVPNVEKVTACMATKRKIVSAACAAFYPKGR